MSTLQYKSVTKEMRGQLRAPLPDAAIKPHPTKTYLSTIKPIYVTERLNDVFGVGAWQLRSEFIEKAAAGTVITKTTLTVPEYGIHYESFGGNDNGGDTSKGFDLGDAYKGSVTDALTKMCSYMEIGIDVFKGLHSKEQPKTPKNTASKPTQTSSAPPSEKKWLNQKTEEWTSAVDRLKKGAVSLDVIKTFFLISKANEAQLIKDSQPQNI